MTGNPETNVKLLCYIFDAMTSVFSFNNLFTKNSYRDTMHLNHVHLHALSSTSLSLLPSIFPFQLQLLFCFLLLWFLPSLWP